jgi:NAD dependent epimerase/dehydratase family enzyme
VQPAAAQASGYTFRFPDLEPALRHLLNRPPRP